MRAAVVKKHRLTEARPRTEARPSTEVRPSVAMSDDYFNMFAPRIKNITVQSVMELPNLTQTDQAIHPNTNNLLALPGSSRRRVSHLPKLKHEDYPHELIEADNSRFFSPHSR